MSEISVRIPAELLERLTAEVEERVLVRLEQAAEPWPGWLSVPTAARYLDVTEERIRKLVARREIPFAQEGPGHRLFFERAALDAWMRSQVLGG
jgi:excisionase family DNA binding protein